MNEITAAIKKKAEEKYELPMFDMVMTSNIFIQSERQAAYTCGGEEWVGLMLKFVEWKERNRYWADWGGFEETLDKNILYWSNDSVKPQNYTTEQLLLKYLTQKQINDKEERG